MLALVAVLLGLAGPPAAYLDTGATHVPLAVSSWCWGSRCGAPIAASKHTAVVGRGMVVRVVLAFAPTQTALAVAGDPVRAQTSGPTVSWRASRGGGFTLRVTGRRGWVTYVGRLVVRG